jgi:hypothetical protein
LFFLVLFFFRQADTLSLVVSSWARVQRAGDSLSSLHSVTRRLHELEQECDALAEQQRNEGALAAEQAVMHGQSRW